MILYDFFDLLFFSKSAGFDGAAIGDVFGFLLLTLVFSCGFCRAEIEY